MLNGAADGFMMGAITGAVMGGIQGGVQYTRTVEQLAQGPQCFAAGTCGNGGWA
ncbi:MAG: hypothetical protein LBK69_02555 [Syntrophomonadaceae bacterium]|nr:hypothetical protein [Syntrophomonadaceae bacterium]